MDTFKFNINRDKRISQIIEAEKLSIGEMRYASRLGCDILFEKDSETSKWNFTFYKYREGTVTEIPMLLAALVSIVRRERQWYKSTSLPIKVEVENFLTEQNIKNPKSIEVADDVLYSIYQGIHYSFETDFALAKMYLTFDDVRELTKYYQQTSISIDMAFQFLASMASIRKNGGDTSYFNDVLIKRKRYDMLQIVDLIEEMTSLDHIEFPIIKKIFLLLYPDLDNMAKSIKQISTDLLDEKDRDALNYHVALSFAGEDRKIAKEIADKLTNAGYKVFYDEYEQAVLWGKDLYSHLTDVYSKRAKYCLMIISDNYAKKHWTNHERKAAQAKAFTDNQEYILPLRLDKTEIPGLNTTVGYIDYNETGLDKTISLLRQKLNG